MVFPKRLDYGFNGYQVPANARAPRSARKRRSFTEKHREDKMCAFNLLATIAGKLLLESEVCATSSNTSFHVDKDECVVVQNNLKKECSNEEKPIKVEICNGENHYQNAHCGCNSVITSHCSDGFDDPKLVNGKTGNGINEIEGFANSVCSESGDVNKDDQDFKPIMNDNLLVHDEKSNVIVSLGSSSEVPAFGEYVPHDSRDDVNLVSRDDDENFPGYIHPNQTKKPYRPVPHIGDRRIRKILASRYWKAVPRSKDLGRTNADMKPSYCNKRSYYKRIRTERNYPIKKRKYFDHILESNSDEGVSREGFKGDDYCSRLKMHKSYGAKSSIKDQKTSFVSRDSHVKLRIKSFKVPELFIEIPETATVGSLKRTVMEAVTAIIGGGLRVGLLLQGKKVRDDSKTLLQTGISQDTHLDALGFCLEPNPSKSPKPICPEVSPLELPCDSPYPLTRYPLTHHDISHQHALDALPERQVTARTGIIIESDHDSAPSPTDDSSAEKSTTDDSRTLVPVPAMNTGALTTMVPHSRKLKRPEVGQRRIRRPFSVTEVEALVQAVEKFGTGRWRDVKLRAFDNAKHRTYVDLKDKWKTLVHTARISPQQRRGEPVPQELLDRVLTAHAYWSQQQPKQHVKQPRPQPQPQAQPQSEPQPETLLLV